MCWVCHKVFVPSFLHQNRGKSIHSWRNGLILLGGPIELFLIPASASLNKTFPSFLPLPYVWIPSLLPCIETFQCLFLSEAQTTEEESRSWKATAKRFRGEKFWLWSCGEEEEGTSNPIKRQGVRCLQVITDVCQTHTPPPSPVSRYLCGPLPNVWRHITVIKMCWVHR